MDKKMDKKIYNSREKIGRKDVSTSIQEKQN